MATSTTGTSSIDLDAMEARLTRLEARVERTADSDALTLVVFSGDLDRLLAAFVIATGAAASAMRVSMFFTFWATAALKKDGPQVGPKTLVERMFGWMLPGGFHKRKLSQLDMAGLGRRLMAREMRKKGVPDLATLIDIAAASNVRINVCEMSMSLMGIRQEEIIDYPGLSYCGVASFLADAAKAGTTLFI